MSAYNNINPDLYLEMEELLSYDIKTGNFKVDKSVFDDFVPNTYINIVFTDSKYPDRIVQYVMVDEDEDGIYMEWLDVIEVKSMCSTCDHKNFETVTVNGTTKLQAPLGTGKMVIRCDLSGHNWKLGVTDNHKDEFALYACPTCGKKLR